MMTPNKHEYLQKAATLLSTAESKPLEEAPERSAPPAAPAKAGLAEQAPAATTDSCETDMADSNVRAQQEGEMPLNVTGLAEAPPSPGVATKERPQDPAHAHATICTKIAEIAAGIDFDVENHIYTDKSTGKEYRSVSSFISRFIPSFNGPEVAERLEKRDGVPAAELLEDWRIRRDYSTVRGSEFHLYVKTFLETARKKALQTPIENSVRLFHQFWQANAHRYTVVANEFMVADAHLGLAGTVDALLYHPKTDSYVLFDWKTNRNIRKTNSYHEKLLPPFDALDDCELSRYSIQMAVYGELIQRTLNIAINKAFLIHFQHHHTHTNNRYKVMETFCLAEWLPTALKQLKS